MCDEAITALTAIRRGKSPPTLHKSAPFLYYLCNVFPLCFKSYFCMNVSGALVIRAEGLIPRTLAS